MYCKVVELYKLKKKKKELVKYFCVYYIYLKFLDTAFV